jgi:predicted permease
MRLPWRRRSESDFSAEVEAHLAHETERLIADGMSALDARAQARKAFGNVLAANERFYESIRWLWLEQFTRDLRYGARALRQSPAFLFTTVLTLAVALSLVTVAFAIFNAYVLRPFAVRDPNSLYRVGWRAPDSGGQQFRWQEFEDLRRHTSEIFSAAIAEHMRLVSSAGRPLAVSFVSDNYFEVLAPHLMLGRGLGPMDAHARAVVLSYQAWSRMFAGDRAALGREIELDDQRFTIVGIVGPRFAGLDEYPRDAWIPYSTYRDVRPIPPGTDPPDDVEIVVRMRAGIPPVRGEAELKPLAARRAHLTKAPADLRSVLLPNATANPISVELLAILSPVFAAFILVLVTACANVSNVMLARAVARHREIAVRLSLGATRARIVRQLMTEGLLIAVLAGAAGLTLAAWLLRAGVVAFFSTLPPSLAALIRVVPLSFDYRVFLFAFAVAMAMTVVFALVPALQASRQRLTDALHGQRSGTRSAARLRSALVVAQVAVSLVLVVTALTLARNFTSLGALHLGYQTRGVISINVRGQQRELIARLTDLLSADPRVAELAVTGGNPLFVQSRNVAVRPQPAGGAKGSDPGLTPYTDLTRFTFVSSEYFAILRLPILRGRSFTDEEARGSASVAVISEATARVFWPHANPIGQTITIERANGRQVEEIPGYTDVTVIGVAADAVSGLLVDGKDVTHMYLPAHARHPQSSALLIRPRSASELRPEALHELFRRTGVDAETFEAVPLDEMRAAQVYPLRAAAWIGGALGAIALVLSISGLYGVLSYTLSQRTREIGIRMALGATAGAVVALVTRQSVRLAGIGAAVGFTIAFMALKFLSSVVTLKEVSLLNALPFAVALTLVLAATAAAAYHPARRAVRVDPAETLRADG